MKVRPWFHGSVIKIDDLENLVIRLKNNDLEARNKIILGCMYLALSVTKRHARYHKIEDLICVSMLALVEAVDRAKIKLKDNNIKPYLVQAIKSRLRRFLKEDSTIKVPRCTQATKKIKVPNVLSEQSLMDEEYDYNYGKEAASSINELIEHLNPFERSIVLMRVAGYVDKEIAHILDVPYSKIYLTRKALHGKVFTNNK